MPKVTVVEAVPVLRIFDVPVALSFYCDYLGCAVDWQEGDPAAGPVYLQVSLGALRLHLSSHHDDGTPGGVVVVEVDDVRALHAALSSTGYAFLNPGLEEGPGEHMLSTQLIDPFSNRLRFFQRDATS